MAERTDRRTLLKQIALGFGAAAAGLAIGPQVVRASNPSTLPIFASQPPGVPMVGSPKITVDGTRLMAGGAPIQLFGPNDQYLMVYAWLSSGAWALNNEWGRNALFPNVLGRIPDVTDADGHFREYFRYFLHYQAVGDPKPNALRIWLADDSWFSDGLYVASLAPTFFDVLDRLIFWAKRAGMYLIPVLGHLARIEQPGYFDPSNILYQHKVATIKAIMERYDSESQIAMWDLFNEPDGHGPWASAKDMDAYRAWLSRFVADVRPSTPGHPITVGHQGHWLAGYDWDSHRLHNELLDVSHAHHYGSQEGPGAQAFVDAQTSFQERLGKPHIDGEIGYWTPPDSFGYWPFLVNAERGAGWAGSMTYNFRDNGRGVYADYPYTGPLPEYPVEPIYVLRTEYLTHTHQGTVPVP